MVVINMSVLKFPSIGSKTLEEMYKYIVDINSTKGLIIFGLGVNPNFALQEMEFAHLVFNNNRQKQYQQVIFSFDNGVQENLSLDIIGEIGQKIAMLFANEYQVIGALHVNSKNWHFHYLINSVNINNGNCYKQDGIVYYYFKEVNKIISTYGLNKIEYYGYENVC